MTISNEEELDGLKKIGAIVADTLQLMTRSIEPGITTGELDDIGRAFLEMQGARSAPELDYDFPGATCISVNEEVAHGIPGTRKIAPGDLVNIDVSAELNGYYGDTGASITLPPAASKITRLCKDGRRAMWVGLGTIAEGRSLADIGNAIGAFAKRGRYSLITNLASHGVGRSLHEEPGEIATWPDRNEKRKMNRGLVFTVEPFLSLGAQMAIEGDDGWTLYGSPGAPTVQYEHTVVVDRNGPIVLTLPTA